MINEEWIEYYVYLEELRQSGETNMFGASPYLESVFGLGRRKAIKVLSNWMENYDELLDKKIINRGE
tara:strand:+ start:22081 stop:22281 length:201 start_codon:yes stop_codon:yes gene_type:complete